MVFMVLFVFCIKMKKKRISDLVRQKVSSGNEEKQIFSITQQMSALLARTFPLHISFQKFVKRTSSGQMAKFFTLHQNCWNLSNYTWRIYELYFNNYYSTLQEFLSVSSNRRWNITYIAKSSNITKRKKMCSACSSIWQFLFLCLVIFTQCAR